MATNGCASDRSGPMMNRCSRPFTKRMTPEDVRMRFFGPLRELSHEMAARMT
jgi:hypothetical protein